MAVYYPVFLQLYDKPCIVVGGGKIAERKVAGLLDAGARVTVISPELTPHLTDLAAENKIVHRARFYQPGDLTGAVIVFCTTNRAEINQQVCRDAFVHKQLVSVADDGTDGNFITPAILRQGDLVIAISTSGKAPALAADVKERLQTEFGPEYSRFLELAGPLRDQLAKNVPNAGARRKVWRELLKSDMIEKLAQGNETAAFETASRILGFPFQPL